MTRARWITSAVTLSLLWLLGGLVVIPRLEKRLESAAREMLAEQSPLQNRLGRMDLRFDGLQARLSGSVRTSQDREAVENALRDQVRAPTPLTGFIGRRLNPVSQVRNEIEVLPYPAGWLMLAASGHEARLMGSTASEYEARDLARSVNATWGAKGGITEGTPTTDATRFDEAADVTATLRSVPEPRDSAQLALTRIGQSWQELHLLQSDDDLHQRASVAGVSDDEWKRDILPTLHALREAHRRQQEADSERRRLAALPPGHLFIATRGPQVILRGEVGSESVKQAVLDEALKVFPPRQVHDEIRVSSKRRPTGEFGPITIALLPESTEHNARTCFLGFSDAAWKPVDWQIAAAEQSWKENLPAELKPANLIDDADTVSGWLQGNGSHVLPAPMSQAPAFLVMALLDDRVIVCGQVAEESVRTQWLAAARRAYGPRRIVTEADLRVRGACAPFPGVLNTLRSLPTAPAAAEAGLFALAVPGGDWIVLDATLELTEAGGLGRSGRLPSELPAALVEEVAAEAIEQLRLHRAPLKSTVSSR